ncbi:MAG: serpin family protein [Planctomycetota bacterium]
MRVPVTLLSCAGALFAAPLPAQDHTVHDASVRAATDPARDAGVLADAIGRFAAAAAPQLQGDTLGWSPASAAMALLMALAGAHGETADEIARAIAPAGWDLARTQRAAAALHRRLQADRPGFAMTSTQDLWIQKAHPLQPSFTTLLRDHYGAAPRELDFRGDPEQARAAINAAIAAATHDRIRDLLGPDDVRADTRCVLTNALWLKADWKHSFDPENTRDRAFRLGDGAAVRVPTMHLTGSFAVGDVDGMVLVRLPYVGDEFALDLALPAAGEGAGDDPMAAALDRLLDPAHGEGRIARKLQQVALALPRFCVSTRLELGPALQTLGITAAFGPTADFRGIDGDPRFLQLARVVQQCWLDVGEEGTEAAAATAMVLRAGAAARQPRAVAFDRPFAFALRDLKTGLVLFAGRVADPRGAGQD